MNPKFFSLPEEKQSAILNAGFHVFSQNTYKKSPMSEIADAAGISKSLLFHYFHNKKELYLFLWDTCCKITVEEMIRSGVSEGCLWEYIRRGCMNVDAMEKDFRKLLEFWKKIYLRKNREEEIAL